VSQTTLHFIPPNTPFRSQSGPTSCSV
jgi:hypothetical protein